MRLHDVAASSARAQRKAPLLFTDLITGLQPRALLPKSPLASAAHPPTNREKLVLAVR